jgi:hypothetical protein
MWSPVEIENIEHMRRRQGIDDAELREQIRRLAIGDLVMLNFLNGATSCARETLAIRITSMRGSVFCGKLAARPAADSGRKEGGWSAGLSAGVLSLTSGCREG